MNLIKHDEGNVSDMEDTDNAHIPKSNLPEGHQIPRTRYVPLPLGGPPGQVTIQPQFFFNKDLDYLLTGDKERRIALSISKLKAARYLDFGLEELVPSLWVESEREYDISAIADVNSQCDQCQGDLQIGLKVTTKINLERPNWDAADYYFKEDNTDHP
ncbi:hypothetical protein Tco_1194432 [Tanacetum coccineum]|uniref:Uncharacterized protein n=1 Tax=Tanacetum coccineum TaxID=301880 RepID=A0ABQ5HGY7_9ASTR